MFQKATRTKARLRLGISGIGGVGKTYTSLRLAMAILKKLPESDRGNGRVALIDTEHKSSKLYADEPNPDGGVFDFDAVYLDEWKGKFSIPNYRTAFKGAADAGYPIAICDTISHAWNGEGGLLEFVDKNSGANAFTSGWKKATPLQHSFIDAILSYPGHLICTMRAKPAYDMVKNSKGKVEPVRVGLQPIQRDGVDHEFTVFGSMDSECRMTIVKTRCTALRGEVITEPGADMANTLMEWLNKGGDASEPKSDVIPPWSADERATFAKAFADVAKKMDPDAIWGFDPYLLGFTQSHKIDLATDESKRGSILKRLRAKEGWDTFDAWCRANESELKGAK